MSKTATIIHPSSIPRTFICGQSIKADVGSGNAIKIDEDSEPARLGTAVHKGCELFIKGVEPDYTELADTYGVDRDEMGMLINTARKLWRETLCVWFNEPEAEKKLKSVLSLKHNLIMSGTLDVFEHFRDDSRAIIGDYKTDRKPGARDYLPQMRGYAELVFNHLLSVKEVNVIIVYLRDKTYISKTIQRDGDERKLFVHKLIETFTEKNPRYVIGQHCGFCPRRYNCEALLCSAQVSAALIKAGDYSDLPDKPEKIAELMIACRQIEKGLKEYKSFVKSWLEGRGGEVELPGGGHIGFKTKKRPILDPIKAWPVAMRFLTDNEIAKAVNLRLKPLLKAVGATADKGFVAKVKENFIAGLDAAEAISYKKYNEIEIEEGKDNE